MGTPRAGPLLNMEKELTDKQKTNLEDMAYRYIALDVGCQPFVRVLEMEKQAILSLMGDSRVRNNPTLHLAYANELKAYDDLLFKIYEKMSPDIKEKHQRISFADQIWNKFLTKKKKELIAPK